MGKQARLTRQRRELLREHKQTLAEVNQQWQDPAMQEKLSGFYDDQCEEFRQQDAAAQVRRLEAARWRLVTENRDGVGHWLHRGHRLSLIHSIAREADGQIWAHVSVGHPDNAMPDWYEVRNAGWVLYPGRFGIVVIAPEGQHVNLSNVAHVWYCLTAPACPDFSHGLGTI